MEKETIIAVASLGGACLLLLVLVVVLFSQVSSLRKRLVDLQNSGRLRVQKLKLENDKNHAFHNPTISPDEELARRGFSMYSGDDPESGRQAPTERQTGGQLVEELSRELSYRQQRQLQQQRPPSPPYDPQWRRPSYDQQWSRQRSPSPPYQPHKNQTPSFLLQSIEQNKKKTRKNLSNPVANYNGRNRQSETNPNFIY